MLRLTATDRFATVLPRTTPARPVMAASPLMAMAPERRPGAIGDPVGWGSGDLAHDLKSQVSYGRKDRGGMHEV